MSRSSHYVTGLRAVEQLLASGGEMRRLFAEYRSANPRVEAVIRTAKQQGVEIRSANRARLSQMSGDARHQGVVAEIQRNTQIDEAALRSLVESRLAGEGSAPLLLLALEAVQDPHNLGACMRTAEAAGVDAVIAPRHASARLGPTVSKVAAGAAERIPYCQVANLAKTLDWAGDYGIRRLATSDRAPRSLYAADLSGPLVLIMGGEHEGLGRQVADRADELVCLPMLGEVQSLNVSVATGVCLYEAVRQRRLASR